MTKIWTLLLAGFFLLSTNLYAAKWSVQVTYPDYEVKNFKLDDMEYKAFLPKTSWRCWVGETQFSNKQELKSLRCNFSVEKTGEFSQVVSCGDKKPFSEVVLDLKDERKNLDFKIHLICRQ